MKKACGILRTAHRIQTVAHAAKPRRRRGRLSEQPFPVRVAAIDVGSNAIRFLAAEFSHPGEHEVLAQIRSPVRLGHGVFQTRVLDAAAMDAAVVTLATYQERMQKLAVTLHRAVATSAVRESRNGPELIERVRRTCGITLEPITGSEEIRLVHQAVRARIRLDGSWLLSDLGGGSVEVAVVDSDAVHWSVSHAMGAVRLLEELEVAGDAPERFHRRLEEYVSTLRVPGRRRVRGFIATGGNSEALAKLTEAPQNEDGVSSVSLSALRAAIAELGAMTVTDRIERFGLRPDRADVILPAAMVYERLCTRIGCDAMLVPHVGVKDGILLDLVDNLAYQPSHLRKHEAIVRSGAIALGQRYRFDGDHAKQVMRLALSLFDQTVELHELGAPERRLLMAAALLHDIGSFVSYKRHHKHSLYIIGQSELPGLTARETAIVANVARYHRKSHPRADHAAFAEMEATDREGVRRLAALLRIADALDREHARQVTAVSVTIDKDEVRLRAHGSGDMVLERWALAKKVALFEEVFERRVIMEGEAEQ